MKKIDKLILKSFIGPFVLTFFVVVFILLTRHMLMYFDDIIGKGLGWKVLGELLFYFAVFMIPTAIPLAVLLSSLITFGNLGEHLELTAIKSAGISLLRVLLPIFLVVVLLTCLAFYANNSLVPNAALEAYSLIFDIKQKKPAMDLREGVFYNDIPGLSIKVGRKFRDDEGALKNILLYDHRAADADTEVIVADSGRMESILHDQYLKFELFSGYRYTEGMTEALELSDKSKISTDAMTRSSFSKTEMVYDLSSFALARTDKKLFENDRLMRNLRELDTDIDSMDNLIRVHQLHYDQKRLIFFTYNNKTANASLSSADPGMTANVVDTIVNAHPGPAVVSLATNMARQVKRQLQADVARMEDYEKQRIIFQIQWHRILANSLACIVMFLIGAPLGGIIRRGDLGVPFLISIFFFIVYYLLGIQGGKLAQLQLVTAATGVWMPNVLLLLIGFVFLRQAQLDARLLERDFYIIVFDRLKKQLQKLYPPLAHYL